MNALWSGPRFAVCWASAGQCCLLGVCSAFALRCTVGCGIDLLVVVSRARFLVVGASVVYVFTFQKRSFNLGN